MANNVTDFLKNNLTTLGAGVGGAAFGGLVGYAAGSKNRVSTKRRKRTTRKSSHKSGNRYTPHTAGKGKDTSHRRIRHTKNGQPYIILASGKAKFIKKSSARSSRKKKGGKY